MIFIGDKCYTFDIDKISEAVIYSDKTESKEQEILDTYENGKVVGKTIRELKTPGNSQIDNIKYDLIKTFIIQVIAYEEVEITDLDDLPFGTKIAMNTLIMGGFLKEINI